MSRTDEHSGRTWLMLSELLDRPNVENDEVSWAEDGSSVAVPVACGSES